MPSASKVEDLVDDQNKPIEENMKKIVKFENKVKFAAFGKRRKQGQFKSLKR